jgi:DUF4097 and DUF4098 domain-containing protein YvlB
MNARIFVILTVMALLLIACEATLSQKYSELEERSFAVGDAPTLTVDNFAGDVTVRAGEGDTIHVVATKRAARKSNLEKIEVEMTERDDGLEIKTDKPSGTKNVSVDLEITAPASTRLDLHTGAGDAIVRDIGGDMRVDSGAGDVEIDDANGEIDAHTGAGDIDVRDVTGPIYLDTGAGDIDVRDATGVVRLDTGAGDIDYGGRPQGDCRFETGAGDIKLRLPADVNVEVDLDTGVGDIDVALNVDGKVSKQEVKGTIGSSDEGEIRAHTGAGDIDLISQ